MRPLIALFWTSGGVCPGFQSQGGGASILSCLGRIPQIHLWYDGSQLLDGQNGSPSGSLHGGNQLERRMPGFECERSRSAYRDGTHLVYCRL